MEEIAGGRHRKRRLKKGRDEAERKWKEETERWRIEERKREA